MIPAELQTSYEFLKKATCPEDVFGKTDRAGVKAAWVGLCFTTHEDKHTDPDAKALARDAFSLLTVWIEEARVKLEAGTYGDGTRVKKAEPVVISTKDQSYTIVDGSLRAGAVCDLFLATNKDDKKVVLKLARSKKDNDLLATEVKHLKKLRDGDQKFYMPYLSNSFALEDGRQVNVLAYRDWPSAQDAIEAYPDGIDPRDVVWMWKRALSALHYTHFNGIVHGAMTPDHIMLDLANHGAKLVGWCNSVPANTALKLMNTKYESYYPEEVTKKDKATCSTDVYMLAKTVVALLGGDAKAFSTSVPKRMSSLLRACLIKGQYARFGNAIDVFSELDKALVPMFGPKVFREFKMPTTGR